MNTYQPYQSQAPASTYIPTANPYAGMQSVGVQAQPVQRTTAQCSGIQQNTAQVVPDNVGCLLGRPVSSREEFLAVPTDLYGNPMYFPDLRDGVIYYKRLNPNTGESELGAFYTAAAWQQMQSQQASQTVQAQPTVSLDDFNSVLQRLNELEEWKSKLVLPSVSKQTVKKGE